MAGSPRHVEQLAGFCGYGEHRFQQSDRVRLRMQVLDGRPQPNQAAGKEFNLGGRLHAGCLVGGDAAQYLGIRA
jgi:hypothetical protein